MFALVAGVIALSVLLGSWVFAFRHAPTFGEGVVTWMKIANPEENWLGYVILAAPNSAVGDERMQRPQPQKLFGPFVYEGALRVGASAAQGV